MERKETMRGLITKHVFSVTRSFAMYVIHLYRNSQCGLSDKTGQGVSSC